MYKFGNFQRGKLLWDYNKTEFVNLHFIVTQICRNLYLFMKLKNFSIIFVFHLAEIKNTFLLQRSIYGPRIQRDAGTKRRQKNRKPDKIEKQ